MVWSMYFNLEIKNQMLKLKLGIPDNLDNFLFRGTNSYREKRASV